LTYSLILSSCDGSDATIKSQMYCLVPISTLTAAPFSLPWGSSIYAQVLAINLYGNSDVSAEQVNGMAVILTNPDAPVSLAEVLASKTQTSIGLSWSNGIANGGAYVTSYTISASTGGGAYVELQTGITTTSTTLTGLTTGTTYTFVV